jgi:hypothetical protein
MAYRHTYSLSVCLGLFACASGPDELAMAPGPVVVAVAEAGTPDSSPPTAVADPGPAPVVVVTGGDDTTPDPGFGPAADASTTRPTQATTDAAQASLPTSTVDAGGTGQGATLIDATVSVPAVDAAASDARSPSTDARAADAAPEAAPACEVSRCDNYCGLARRCCNAEQECACLSLLRTCTLPSLPRPGLP